MSAVRDTIWSRFSLVLFGVNLGWALTTYIESTHPKALITYCVVAVSALAVVSAIEIADHLREKKIDQRSQSH